jgi:purine-binding chemotaxis protein CheW
MTVSPSISPSRPNTLFERAGKYLTFELSNEVYGLPVLRVREVIGKQGVAKIPHAPEYVKGVINLRGKVIPIIDLRMKFGLKQVEQTDRTCIIVVQLNVRKSTVLAGAVVDRVSEVVTVAAADIDDTPDFGDGTNLPYVLGIAKTKDGVRILVDPDVLFEVAQLMQMQAATQSRGDRVGGE